MTPLEAGLQVVEEGSAGPPLVLSAGSRGSHEPHRDDPEDWAHGNQQIGRASCDRTPPGARSAADPVADGGGGVGRGGVDGSLRPPGGAVDSRRDRLLDGQQVQRRIQSDNLWLDHGRRCVDLKDNHEDRRRKDRRRKDQRCPQGIDEHDHGDDDRTDDHHDDDDGTSHLGSVVTAPVASGCFEAIGTTVVYSTTEPTALAELAEIVRHHVDALDLAASRFRADSDITKLNASNGSAVVVSDLLYEAIADAVRAAAVTDGLVSPTVGEAMRIIGYDRDFAEVARSGGPVRVRVAAVPGWTAIELDPDRRTVKVPMGIALDLGATAKAACADRAARAGSATTCAGVLVSLGGDVAVAGPAPENGWAIRISDRHDAPASEPGPVVAVREGGLATSGTSARRWERGGRPLHHLIDPATGLSARTCWRTASVAHATCLEANTASTASVLLGSAAPAWLADRGLHARLVHNDGTVVRIGQWPAETSGRRAS